RHVDRGLAPSGLVAVGLATLLDRVVAAPRHVRLAAEDHLAGGSGTQRQEELPLAHLPAVDLDEEIEQPPLAVVTRDVEGIEVDERSRGLVSEAGDLLGLMDQGRLRGDLVERREALDPPLAVATAGDRTEG